MQTYELLQIPRDRSELRCAVAARQRPLHLDDDETAVARVLETCDVIVDPRDRSVAHCMKTIGSWEWWITRVMADCMRPGTVCVDIGANCGYFAAVFVALGASRVIAIEPHPRLAARLRQTAIQNQWTQLEVIEFAVGDVPGRANLFVYGDDNLGGSTLVAELIVGHEAEVWLNELTEEGGQLRFVDYDASIQELRIDQIHERPLWMLYLHKDES